jgi:hypothetical protein
MENKVSNLIKNVLEENALKFKEHTSEILYSKVSNRLKQQYVEVSKNLFKNINERVGYPEYLEDPEMSAPPAKGNEKPPKEEEKYPDPGPPPINPFPNGVPKRPDREKYPKGREGDEAYREDLYIWEQAIKRWQQYLKDLEIWRRKHTVWKQHLYGEPYRKKD